MMLARINSTDPPPREEIRACVQDLLNHIVQRAPGRSVEIRVPPFAAVQAIEGVSHRRGTPPAVVEMDPSTLIALAAGDLQWVEAVASGRVQASGERADLARFFPLVRD
jgi:hypothetical protein